MRENLIIKEASSYRTIEKFSESLKNNVFAVKDIIKKDILSHQHIVDLTYYK